MPEWLWWVLIMGVGIPLLILLVWLNEAKDDDPKQESS